MGGISGCLIFMLFALIQGGKAQSAQGLCKHEACHCYKAIHPSKVNVNCTFNETEHVALSDVSLPSNAYEVTISGGRELVLGALSFSNKSDLVLLSVSGVPRVHVEPHAFLELGGPHLLLTISTSPYVTVDTDAFKNAKGPTTVNISRCENVILHKKAFFWLVEISINDVASLDLSNGTFVLDKKPGTRGPVTKIIFNNVTSAALPSSTFGTSVAEIRFHRANIETIHPNAFNGMLYNAVIAINSTFGKILKGAFPQKCLINKIEFSDCTVRLFESEALLSSAQALYIKNCFIREVARGACNSKAATVVITDNEFELVRMDGFELQEWDVMRIERNLFNRLEPGAFVSANYNNNGQFSFVDNLLMKVSPGSLKFISDVQAVLPVVVYTNNYFLQECSCSMDKWLLQVFGQNLAAVKTIMNNSYCSTSNPHIAHCLNVLTEGNMQMTNYTLALCGNNKSINCTYSNATNVSLVDEIKNTKFQNRRNHEVDDDDMDSRVKILLISLLAIALTAAFIFILAKLIQYARRKGYCTDVKNAIISSNNCCVSLFDRCNVYGVDTARSISRLSINEYTESHRLNDTRALSGAIDLENFTDHPVAMCDKATQTLPEELTKELLESLREKLDDPENYSEAREMIEHLYDLIKVEECCNTNVAPAFEDRDNLYDVIQAPVRHNKVMVSVGTRTPSLERLAPFGPALSPEYLEPRDRAQPVYAELPGEARAMPDLLGQGSRPLSFLRAIGERIAPPPPPAAARMANRPLPEAPKRP